MTITNKTIAITLEEKELEALVSALEDAAMMRGQLYGKATPENAEKRYAEYDVVRQLRNSFGAIIGKHYMGTDY